MKRSEIEQLLPEVFQRAIVPGHPLAALLDTMEALHMPSESILGAIDRYFNPYQAPDAFVPFLASWLDLDRILARAPAQLDAESAQALLPSGLGRLRELTAEAAYLSKWRGTAQGIIRFLEVATGVRGFAIDEQVAGADGRPRPFHIVVSVPAEAQAYTSVVTRIVEQEKPAYVTYELRSNH
jgi:phage tail-like protein